MNFEPMKREDIEVDKLNIKSHLNTSLEAEGISVSEDLISRTMDAIRRNEVNNSDTGQDNMEHKKLVFFRHTRTLVTVAAAALILVVGINALRMLSPLGSKSDMSKSQNSVSDDAGKTEIFYTTERSREENKEAYDQDTSDGSKSDAPMVGALADEATVDMTEEEEQSFDMKISKSEEQTEEPGVGGRVMAIQGDALTFTEVINIESTEVSSITISSMTADMTNTIANQDQIDKFYSVMNEYLFMQSEAEDTNTLYVVSLASEDGDSQLLISETNIAVNYTRNGTISHGIYSAADHSRLLEEIKNLLAD